MAARTRTIALALGLGLATGLAWDCVSPERVSLAPAGAAPHRVVLVTLDTTRADHLGSYGYEAGTSPRLDELAADALRFTTALSTSSWTLPAHASLFTGKFPSSHGAHYDPRGELILSASISGSSNLDRYRAHGLSPDESTLATLLADAGVATAAVVAGPWMKAVFGLGAGFDHYDDSGIDAVAGRRAEAVTDAALAWLKGRAEEPFFLFLNYYDPHWPYSPEQAPVMPLDAGTDDRIARYDAEIRYMDRHLGRLFDELKRMGAYDDAWIIVTADHGELLGEHGFWGHGHTLTEPELRVPLLVKRPGNARAGQREDEPVQLVDVFPMLLSGLGIAIPEGIQGHVPPEIGHPVVAEVYPLLGADQQGVWQTLHQGGYKLAWQALGNPLLFHLERDPREQHNLAPAHPERVASMERELRRYLAALPQPPARSAQPREVDPQTVEALRQLGYLAGDDPAQHDP